MTKKHFLILHGWQGNETNHWQTILAEQLEALGHEVSYPQFSESENPKLKQWLSELQDTIDKIPENRKVIVATHSLGGALWLHYIAKKPNFKTAMVILSAPPLDNCGIPEIANFFPIPLKKLSDIELENYLIIGSDNDKYIQLYKFKKLAMVLQIPLVILPRAGHINVKSGFGEWPWMLDQISSKSVVLEKNL